MLSAMLKQSVETNPSRTTMRRAGALTIVFLFWYLRMTYWHSTHDEIFSDMEQYVGIAQNIIDSFFFGISEKYAAYWSPGTSVAIAIAKLLMPADFMAFYRPMVAVINFVGIILIAVEIYMLTRREHLAWMFLVAMAVLKPSIFWSLKPSTEGISEALLHVTIGLAMLTARKRTVSMAALLGVVFVWLFLARPQYVIGLPFLMLFLFLRGNQRDRQASLREIWVDHFRLLVAAPRQFLRAQALLICFLAAVAVAWTPWVVRNYRIYDTFIPFGLSGKLSAMFEWGGVPVKVGRYTSIPLSNGEIFEPGWQNFQRFYETSRSDLECTNYGMEIASFWFRENLKEMPLVVYWRLRNMVSEISHGGLSKVSRDILFPGRTSGYNNPYQREGFRNIILIDKAPLIVLLGFAGYLLLWLRYPVQALPLIGLAVFPWGVAALFLGYARTVEPLIGTSILGAIYFLSYVVCRDVRPEKQHPAGG